MGIIDDIIDLEWKELREIKKTDEGEKNFEIMRKSQFDLWSPELLNSYYMDLKSANERGWSLILEKYVRILEYTDFVQYHNMLNMVPTVEQETEEVIDMIVLVQNFWMEQFEKRYPRLAKASKTIQAFENEETEVTYAQVLKCELLTYSANTMLLYAQMIIDYKKRNINYIQKMMEVACKYYGYVMIDEAERKLVD